MVIITIFQKKIKILKKLNKHNNLNPFNAFVKIQTVKVETNCRNKSLGVQ